MSPYRRACAATKRGRKIRRRVRLRPPTKTQIKKEIRRLLKPQHQIECYYSGYDRDLDHEIERLVKRPSAGSGMHMIIGLRDISFDGFSSEAKALAAAKRVKAKLRGVRVMLRSFKKAP